MSEQAYKDQSILLLMGVFTIFDRLHTTMAASKRKKGGGKRKGGQKKKKGEKCQVGCAAANNNVVTGGGRKRRGRKVGGNALDLTQSKGLSGGTQEMPKEFITFR